MRSADVFLDAVKLLLISAICGAKYDSFFLRSALGITILSVTLVKVVKRKELINRGYDIFKLFQIIAETLN